MRKDTKVCPFCHDPTMKPDDDLGKDWFKCSKCGATNNSNPTISREGGLVVEKLVLGSPETKYRPRKKRKPKASARA